MVAFDAAVLSEAIGRDIRLGKIVHGDRSATLNVETSSLITEVRMHIKSCAALAANTSPPDLVLNRHCGQCEFQGRCQKQATEKDDLSLLGGMSDKERKKLHDKGIFTVTQLSYTFRPRRRRRDAQDRQEKYHHSLRALAIRKDKIQCRRRPGPETRRHAGLSGCRRSSGPRFLLPDRNLRRKRRGRRSTQLLGR
jgi:predicted RecB family nuclease